VPLLCERRIPSGRKRRVLAAVVACIGLVLALPAVLARADPNATLAWSGPESIDTDPAPVPLQAVTCASEVLCVGLDAQGDVVSSTDPFAAHPTWSATFVAGGLTLRAASCVSTTACVVVGWAANVSQVFTSDAPSAGAWAATTLPQPSSEGTTELSSLSCVSSLCVAGSFSSAVGGEVVWSTDPAGGSGAWTVVPVSTESFVSGVSCVSGSLCVAVDSGGDILTSNDPTGGTSAWTVIHTAGWHGFTGVSCPSATLCVAVDSEGNMLTSTDPTGGAAAWVEVGGTPPDPSGYAAVSCASTTLCVATDQSDGGLVASTDPTGGAAAWVPASVDPGTGLASVSCVPGTTACVAISAADGDVADTTNAAAGAGWSLERNADGLTRLDGPKHTIDGVSCIASPLCVAVDDVGNILASENPAAGAQSWTRTDVDGNTAINAITCLTGPLCVAVDDKGNILTSTDPTSGAGAWTITAVDPTDEFTNVTCVSGPLCLVTGSLSKMYTSTDPAAGASAWSSIPFDGRWAPAQPSCATTAFCVGINPSSGEVLATTDPTAGIAAWQNEGNVLLLMGDVSCPTTNLCVAVSPFYNDVLWTSDPFAGYTSWTDTPITYANGPGLWDITCVTSQMCLLLEGNNEIASTTNPTGGTGAWTITPIGATLYSISCADQTLCVGVGDQGDVVVGTPPTPPLRTAPASPRANPPTPPTTHPAPIATPTKAAHVLIEAAHVTRTTASFRLAVTGTAAKLECALQRKRPHNRPPAYRMCSLHPRYRHLHRGAYTLYARAVSTTGAITPPATHRFHTR
jgi:hypothetical protein